MEAPAATSRPTAVATAPKFTPYQTFVVSLLAFLQFTIILDFMILSPLGAILMPALHITPSQFGLVVSGYAFSAGAAGLLAAGFADRYDRKKLLMFFYSGFLLGTLFCALAPTFPLLLAARMVTGLFGGVIGSITFAITTDMFPYEVRGRVMGYVQTAFAASQILGLPVGLYFANLWGWHAPFLMIVIVGALVGLVIWKYLKPIDGHLKLHPDRSAFHHLSTTVSTPRYLRAFATTALLATGGFMLMPFSSAFTVHNLGIELSRLPLLYMITGCCAIVVGPLVGRAADKYGKFKVFLAGSSVSMVTVFFYSRLHETSFWTLVGISALMFAGVSSRMIPSQAMMSAVPTPADRGSFMSVSSSVQQISGGIAAVLGGMIVSEGPGGVLEHFDTLGNVVIGASCVTLFMMYRIASTLQAPPPRG